MVHLCYRIQSEQFLNSYLVKEACYVQYKGCAFDIRICVICRIYYPSVNTGFLCVSLGWRVGGLRVMLVISS